MLESLIITLREGIEAALVVGILLVSLKKMNRQDLSRYVYWGLGAAVAASAVGAVVLQMVVLNEEVYEGVLYLMSAVFVSTMLYWMRQHARTLKTDIETRVGTLAIQKKVTSQAMGLFAFSFLMVFREGVETVLFLSAVGLTTEKIFSFIGGLLGLTLAVFFCMAFVKGTVRINLTRFFQISTVVLVIFVIQLLINGFHELSEAGVLPASQREMALVGPVVRNNAFFILAILCIPLLLALFRSKSTPEMPAAEGPEKRLFLAREKTQKRWHIFWMGSSFVILSLLGVHAVYSGRSMKLDPPIVLQIHQGEVSVPIEAVSDGRLHRYGVQMEQSLVRFLVIKNGENFYRTAFDLCRICGDYGYVQRGADIICLNCSAAIFAPSIGVPGGCNPVPLESHQSGDQMVVRVSDLAAFEGHFTQKFETEVFCEICNMKLHPEEALMKELPDGKRVYLCPMKSCQEEWSRRVLQNPQ